MTRIEKRSNRRIAFMYFFTRWHRAKRRGDLVCQDKLREILVSIQQDCPHSEAGRFQAKVSGFKVRAGQWFTMCLECNKLLSHGDT